MIKMKHETFEARRESLKNENPDKFIAFKARRYAMFRMQTFLEGGCAPEADHILVFKAVEDEVKPLDGALGFAKRWDFDPFTGRIVMRDKSVWEAHDEFMRKAAPELGTIAAQRATEKAKLAQVN